MPVNVWRCTRPHMQPGDAHRRSSLSVRMAPAEATVLPRPPAICLKRVPNDCGLGSSAGASSSPDSLSVSGGGIVASACAGLCCSMACSAADGSGDSSVCSPEAASSTLCCLCLCLYSRYMPAGSIKTCRAAQTLRNGDLVAKPPGQHFFFLAGSIFEAHLTVRPGKPASSLLEPTRQQSTLCCCGAQANLQTKLKTVHAQSQPLSKSSYQQGQQAACLCQGKFLDLMVGRPPCGRLTL